MYIPIEKDNPVTNTPWIVYGLIVINSLIFIYTAYILDLHVVTKQFGFIPSDPNPSTALTSVFLHAGIWHLIGNMFFLYMFGDNVEDVLGKPLFIFSYILCGVSANALHYLFNMDSTIPCVGASGAISGIMGMYMMLFPNAHVDIVVHLRGWEVARQNTKAYGAILAWLALQVVFGLIAFALHDVPIFRVAFWAHAGGLVTGIVLGYVFKLIGINPPIPQQEYVIMRKEEGSFWCPYCGKEEPKLKFGNYTCSACGAKYAFVKETEEE